MFDANQSEFLRGKASFSGTAPSAPENALQPVLAEFRSKDMTPARNSKTARKPRRNWCRGAS